MASVSAKPPQKRKSRGKSRFGCVPCKTKRIKCDEHQPACRQCADRGRECHYKPLKDTNPALRSQPPVWNAHDTISTAPASRKRRTPPENGDQDQVKTAVHSTSHEYQISNDAFRRVSYFYRSAATIAGSPSLSNAINLSHMALLLNFKDNTARALLSPKDTWSRGVLNLALKHEFVMHSLLMISAKHLSILERDNTVMHRCAELQHRQNVLTSLREILTTHKGTFATNKEIRDGVLGCTLLLALHSCASVEDTDDDDEREPGKAPNFATDEFLPLWTGVRDISRTIWANREDSMFLEFLEKPLLLIDDDSEPNTNPNTNGSRSGEVRADSARAYSQSASCVYPISMNYSAAAGPSSSHSQQGEYIHRFHETAAPAKVIRSQSIPFPEQLSSTPTPEEICAVAFKYLRPLLCILFSYYPSQQQHEHTRMSRIDLLCLILSWASFVPPEFIDLVKVQNPRALVIMAHYYAAGVMLAMPVDGVNVMPWWWRDRPRVMCGSICRHLGDEWAEFVRWPRSMVGL